MDFKEKLDLHLKLYDELLNYFGVPGDWTVYPFNDMTHIKWYANINGPFGNNRLYFMDKFEDKDELFSEILIPVCHSNKDDHNHVYLVQRDDYTLVLMDTQTDRNIFYVILDTKKYDKSLE